MRYLFLVVIAISCIGCAGTISGNKSTGGPFSIGSKGGSLRGLFTILSIRDSGLIISPVTSSADTLTNFSSAQFLHTDSIRWIQNNSLTGLSFTGGIVGAVAGTVAGVLIGGAGKTGLDALKPSTYGGIAGMPIGMLLGGIVFKPQSSFDLTNPDDREILISLCKYCGREPEEITRIR